MFHKEQPQTLTTGENKSAKPLASLEGLGSEYRYEPLHCLS